MDQRILVFDQSQQSQLLGMRDAEPLIKHFVCDRENGGIRTDRQGKRCDSNHSEPRALSQDARRVPQIAPELIPPAQADGGAHAVLVGGDTAELELRLSSSLIPCEAGEDEILRMAFEVEA